MAAAVASLILLPPLAFQAALGRLARGPHGRYPVPDDVTVGLFTLQSRKKEQLKSGRSQK